MWKLSVAFPEGRAVEHIPGKDRTVNMRFHARMGPARNSAFALKTRVGCQGRPIMWNGGGEAGRCAQKLIVDGSVSGVAADRSRLFLITHLMLHVERRAALQARFWAIRSV
jgi:hypothetical protein